MQLMTLSDVCKAVVICCLTGVVLGAGLAAAFAKDAMVLDKNRNAVISGVVSDIDERNGITLQSAGQQIHVDVSDLNLGRSLPELVKLGSKVTLSGHFTTLGTQPEFEATQLALNNGDKDLSDNETVLMQQQQGLHE